MAWIDTHAHLADPSLHSQLNEVLQRSHLAGVRGILCVAVDASTSLQCQSIAKSHSTDLVELRYSAGIHPNYAHQIKDEDWGVIEQLIEDRSVVALGETGLDLYWDDCPLDIQKVHFAKHWELSRKHQLPVIVHMRECEEEMLQFLEQEHSHGPLLGIMHSFSGSESTAKRCVELGMYISFAGMLTYKKSEDLRQVASKVPLDRLLLETDCPYLSPEPHRSKRPNEPARIIHTAQVLAEAKTISVSELSRAIQANTKRLFTRW